MKRQKFQAVIAVALSALGLQDLPKGEDGKLVLDAKQTDDLKATFTGPNYEVFVRVANEILAEEAGITTAEQAEKDSANALLASVLKGNAGGEEGEAPAVPATPVATAQQVVAKVQEQAATIQTLMAEPENRPATVSAGRAVLFGTALLASISTPTHLFGTNPQAANKIFAFEGRNWNAIAAGKSAAKTDFTDVSTITRLNADLK